MPLLADSESKTNLQEGIVEEAPILSVSRHLLQPNGSIIGSKVSKCILPMFDTFCSAIPTTLGGTQQQQQPHPALACIDGRHSLTHARVYDFSQQFGGVLHALGFGKQDRVALVLPNGPELALALVATAQWACAVPLNANGAPSELEADLQRCGADLVIGPYSGPLEGAANKGPVDSRFYIPSAASKDWSAFGFVQDSAERLGIPFCGLVPSTTEAGVFRLATSCLDDLIRFEDVQELPSHSIREDNNKKVTAEPNGHDDEVLVLFTSGTTGNKKLVPHRMGDMLTAATTIALSWDLGPMDVNCNLMPLFHVGGIVRQIFSPLFSGGCVICCPSFDPSIFWYLLDKRAFSWYYAAPTMHQLILQTGKADGYTGKNLTLRMIANAAGGLLPSLADELMEVFEANVRIVLIDCFINFYCFLTILPVFANTLLFQLQILPSYGMTECAYSCSCLCGRLGFIAIF